MKKLTFLVGIGVGFVLGSRTGRGPYEQLEGSVRKLMNQPKVQSTLQSAADSAESVRDTALDRTSDVIDDVSRAANRTVDETSRRIRNGSEDSTSKVGNRGA